jgi:hypothetical protein
MNVRMALGVGLCLFLTGCDDSKNPLSDPTTSEPDKRLDGVWQLPHKSGMTYYHVGHWEKKFPEGLMRVAQVLHEKRMVLPPNEFLMFPTVVADKTYLNVINSKALRELSNANRWNAEAVDSYCVLRYQVEGDKLTIWYMDGAAKKRAIEQGKIKGVIEKDKPAEFTDTTENLVRLVTEAGDGLFAKTPVKLQRVTAFPPTIERPTAPTPPLRPLGSNLKVDKNDIIWDDGHPVGIWGIDGRHARPADYR